MVNVSSAGWSGDAFVNGVSRVVDDRWCVTAVSSNPVVAVETNLPNGIRLFLIEGNGAEVRASW